MSDEQPRRGWGRGFAWGCLTPLIIIGLIVAGAVGFAGYYGLFGYKSDTGFQTAMQAVQSNPVARNVLGDNIALSGFPSYSFRYDSTGHHASYNFAVQGSRGAGNVAAYLEGSGSQCRIKSLVLTGPGGQTYNLIGSAAPGSSNNETMLLPPPNVKRT